VAITTALHTDPPRIVSDGAGGAIVTWAAGGRIYAQRVNATGVPQWTVDGVALRTIASSQGDPAIAADGAGGAIVSWQETRPGNLSLSDIYAQRVSAAGVPQWTADAVALCTVARDQWFSTVVSDGTGGAIVAWQDYRSNTNFDIYAQRVQANGELGGVAGVPREAPLALALEPVRPNPSLGGTLTVQFTLASPAAAALELFDVAGRRIVRRELGSFGAGHHALALGAGPGLAPGLYLVCLRQGTNTRVTRVVVLK
jgi:hypothetical protein